MATNIDICNRALQMIGAKIQITSLASTADAESINCNMLYEPVRDWCMSLANWNFARKITVPVLSKIYPNTANTAWTSTYPPPPWKYEYLFPADALAIRYVTDQTQATDNTWNGNPYKFAVVSDLLSSEQVRVIVTNRLGALIVYTMLVSDVNKWPAMFTQAVVSNLAWLLAMPLTGDQNLANNLKNTAAEHMQLAIEFNRQEGLFTDDTTAEWKQARGIPYNNNRAQQAAVRRAPSGDKSNG